MKAVRLHEYGAPSKLIYEDAPDPIPAEGEVLVSTAAASINPVDYKIRQGGYQHRFPQTLPAILGRDISGIVAALGPNTTGFTIGDRVMALAKQTYAELVTVKASDLAHVPGGLDLVEAAALPLVTLTGHQLITRACELQPGQTVLVTGAVGGVGRTAVFTAKQIGATVIAGVRASQLEEAKTIGADEILILDDDNIAKFGLIDAVANAIAGPIAEKLLHHIKPGGVFGTVLAPPETAKLHPTIRINPIMVEPNAQDLYDLAVAVRDHKLHIPIDRMIPLSETAEGHAAFEKGGIGKVLLLASEKKAWT